VEHFGKNLDCFWLKHYEFGEAKNQFVTWEITYQVSKHYKLLPYTEIKKSLHLAKPLPIQHFQEDFEHLVSTIFNYNFATISLSIK